MFTEKFKELKVAVINNNDVSDAIEIIEFLDSRVAKMPEYLVAIVNHVTGTDSARKLHAIGYMSTENLQTRLETLNGNRTASHDVAMAAMDQINRIAVQYGLDRLCPEVDDRTMRANFAAAVTMECFMYDHNQSKEEIAEMYDLVRASANDANIDKVVELTKEGATIDTKRKVAELDR